MELLRIYLREEIKELFESGIRLRVIGDRNGLESDIRRLIASAEARTKSNNELNLTVALNYGGRREILIAIQNLISDMKSGKIDPNHINERGFEEYLETSEIPNPDLLIRTSGERRISNFLLWQTAYTELYMIDTFWPDFREKQLLEAVLDYQNRERRFGMVSNQV